ncbi:hypothetical protein AGMMS50229_15460 [Campylobacterota bacterium]|nr:hypothetical protein AGMMS50229_15460 [Campylobacterota bacterium]
MSFGEKFGFEPEKAIQVSSIDQALRNRLYNLFDEIMNDTDLMSITFNNGAGVDMCIAESVDKIGMQRHNIKDNKTAFLLTIMGHDRRTPHYIPNNKWYAVYELIEEFVKKFSKLFPKRSIPMVKKLNKILTEEKSGFRFFDDRFVKVTDEQELASLEKSTHSPFPSVNAHTKKALDLYSNRVKPDYENTIKESICAVEAICVVLTGSTGKEATLGKAIKKLENNDIRIHQSLQEAYVKIYGYTSDEGGIRHGSIDFHDAPEEDAKYMLISCSAFVNYLVAKHIKITDNQRMPLTKK